MTARDPAAVGARRVVLARYRPGLVGRQARTVHLIPLPTRADATGAVRTLCGGQLGTAQIEMVTPGEGVPCTHRVTGSLLLPPAVTPSGPLLWVHPPTPDTLHLCREIDIFGALHTLGTVGGGP